MPQAQTGGGNWRLRWHPHRPHVLLAACMYGGCAVLRASTCWGQLDVVQTYKVGQEVQGGSSSIDEMQGQIKHGKRLALACANCPTALSPHRCRRLPHRPSLHVCAQGHGSIAYGADWVKAGALQNGSLSNQAVQSGSKNGVIQVGQAQGTASQCGTEEGTGAHLHGQQEQLDLILTCSFYDRLLHLWSPDSLTD